LHFEVYLILCQHYFYILIFFIFFLTFLPIIIQTISEGKDKL